MELNKIMSDHTKLIMGKIQEVASGLAPVSAAAVARMRLNVSLRLSAQERGPIGLIWVRPRGYATGLPPLGVRRPRPRYLD